jgi:hypothetical protein
MKKLYLLILLNLNLFLSLTAQVRAEDFEIKLSKKKHSNALYNKISYFDIRPDVSNFGAVKVGRNNEVALVKPKYPMSSQIENMFTSMVDSTAKNGRLILQLIQLELLESANETEIGYSFFKADMYTVIDNKCLKINSIDTSLKFDFGADVTSMLIASTANMINYFVSQSLYKAPQDSNYLSLYLITKHDSIEKSKIPLYTIKELKDGVYYTYNAFKNQMPDNKCFIKMNKDKVEKVSPLTNEGTYFNSSKIIFTAVYMGKCFINSEAEFVELKRENEDFYFVSIIHQNPSEGRVLAKIILNNGGYHRSINGNPLVIMPLGFLINTDGKNVKTKMRLNYQNGNSIFVKLLEE